MPRLLVGPRTDIELTRPDLTLKFLKARKTKAQHTYTETHIHLTLRACMCYESWEKHSKKKAAVSSFQEFET